ncbi:hypothetical protein [Daejeonella sp.]|uniref:hypothetical protein n=1 Tax=Daejeonella sp. TaxID=2805397 RepID=UPI002731EC39|nr:hypothetical protein [Daejeonella sp.]MDP2413725.1 hypothetical protein [Daejeonella sp.]
MRILFIIFGLLVFTSGKAKAQHSDSNKNNQTMLNLQDSLQILSYKMINDSIEPERYNANYKFIKTLVNSLKTPYSFNFSFDSLKTISIQSSSDKRFRIFSWHVMNNDGSYRYYGTIQMNNPDGKLQMFPLVDYTPAIKNSADTITTSDKWYGAQYYRVISVLNNVQTPYYVLLGWKGNTVRSTKKVMEILYFKDGKAYFGMPVFDGDKEQPFKKRAIFEYDRRASMVLNYEPSISTVVFDHLAPPDPKLKGRFELYGPDFSYDGYRLVNCRWKFVQDLELKNMPTDQDDNFNDPKKMKGNR